MKLFSMYSNLCDHDTSTSQTDGRTDGLIAVAIPRSAYSIARWKYSSSATFSCLRKKSSQEYRELKTVVEAVSSKQNMSKIQKQNRKRNHDMAAAWW